MAWAALGLAAQRTPPGSQTLRVLSPMAARSLSLTVGLHQHEAPKQCSPPTKSFHGAMFACELPETQPAEKAPPSPTVSLDLSNEK